MTNLYLLQRICEQVNIERPSALNSLTIEQQQILRFLDEQHIEICGKKDWWFLQRTGDLSLWPYNITGTVAVSAGGAVTVSGATPFPASPASNVNGKMQIGTAVTYCNDVVRVNTTNTTTATVQSAWAHRGEVTAGASYFYGQDEYTLATDCDRVSWVLCWRGGSASVSHRVLEAITSGELENLRGNRANYFEYGQPLNYCVLKHGALSSHIRSIVFDPFPEFTANITYGYFIKPPTLYSSSTITPALPPKYEQFLCDKTALQYYATLGMGAPAGSPAGQDLQNRVTETAKDVLEAEGQMMQDQKTAQELASMDSSGLNRMFFDQTFGRSI